MYSTKDFLEDIDDAKEKQYLVLREGILKRMEAQRRISMFAVTSILAFYTIIFSLDVEQAYVFLLPIIVLLPFSYKELSHKISISYLVGYQIVCLENNKNVSKAFTWETDFFLFKRKKYDNMPRIFLEKLTDSEFLILSILSYLFYILYFIKYNLDRSDFGSDENILGYIVGIVFLFLIIIIGWVTREYNLYVNSVGYYVKRWLKFMLDEGRIDLETYKARFMELIGEEIQGETVPL